MAWVSLPQRTTGYKVTSTDWNAIIGDLEILSGTTGAVYNVKGYGATGDGSTDDTTAIQAAFTAAGVSGGIVGIPAGTYKVSSTITFQSDVSIVGVGKNLSVLKGNGTVTPILANVQTSGTINRVTLRDFSIVGTSGPSGGIGLQLSGVTLSLFENMRISGLTGTTQVCLQCTSWLDGATYRHTIENTFNHIETVGTNGIQLTVNASDPTTSGCNNNHLLGMRCSSYTGTGIDILHGEGNTLVGCVCSTPTDATTGIHVADDVTTILGCNTDCSAGGGNTAIGIKIDSGVNDTTIINRGGNGPTTSISDSGTNTIIFRHPNTHIGGTVVIGNASNGLGFYGASSVAKPTVTGSRASNVALTSLLTALNTLGLLTDSST